MGKSMKETRDTRRKRRARSQHRKSTFYRMLARTFDGMVRVSFLPEAFVCVQRLSSGLNTYRWVPQPISGRRRDWRWPRHDDDEAFIAIGLKLRAAGLPISLKGGCWRVPYKLVPQELQDPSRIICVNEKQLELLIAHLRKVVLEDPERYKTLMVVGALASGL